MILKKKEKIKYLSPSWLTNLCVNTHLIFLGWRLLYNVYCFIVISLICKLWHIICIYIYSVESLEASEKAHSHHCFIETFQYHNYSWVQSENMFPTMKGDESIRFHVPLIRINYCDAKDEIEKLQETSKKYVRYIYLNILRFFYFPSQNTFKLYSAAPYYRLLQINTNVHQSWLWKRCVTKEFQNKYQTGVDIGRTGYLTLFTLPP